MEALLGSSGDVKSTISVIKTRSSIKPAREGLKPDKREKEMAWAAEKM